MWPISVLVYILDCVLYNACFAVKKNNRSTPVGFEPTRDKPNGFQVHRLNHSATVSTVGWDNIHKNNLSILVLTEDCERY
jgi:hypothetical protein